MLSLVVAAAYAAVAVSGHVPGSGKWAIGLVFPLALIWFPEEIGNLTGYFKTGYVNVQTPGVIVSFLGWFFLVGLPLILFLVLRLQRGA